MALIRLSTQFCGPRAESTGRAVWDRGLVDQQYGNAVTNRVGAAAAGALEKSAIRGKIQGFAALRNGATQGVQQLL